jgi:leucyl aminopeptidase
MITLNFVKAGLGDVDVLVVPVLPDGKAGVQLPAAISERLAFQLKQSDFSAKADELTTDFVTIDGRTIKLVFVGCGEKSEFTDDGLRATGARTYVGLGTVDKKSIGYFYDEKILSANSQLLLLEGLFLRNYFDSRYKTGDEAKKLQGKIIAQLTLVGNVPADVKKELQRLQVITDNVHLARTLTGMPAGELKPEDLANTAKSIVKENSNLEIKVLHKADLEKEGMNLLLAVNRGSAYEPRLIVMTLNAAKKEPPVVLVGKGITFDSGGYNLKPSGGMEVMHTDMAGAAAVIGAIKTLAELGFKRKVIGIVPATENLVSGDAYKPSDIITSHAGLTVEIGNTDAEGRLVLADALSYAQRFSPSVIIDLATLTGACMVALGERYAGIFSDQKDLIKQIQKAADISGDKVWPLPLDQAFKDKMKGKISDLNNLGPLDRLAGASTGAAFLSYFAGGRRWAHIDIAGPSHQSKELEAWNPPSGMTGYGVRLLVELVTEQL